MNRNSSPYPVKKVKDAILAGKTDAEIIKDIFKSDTSYYAFVMNVRKAMELLKIK